MPKRYKVQRTLPETIDQFQPTNEPPEFEGYQERTLEIFKKSPASEQIPVELYSKYGVKRGLRNDNGTGVLTGLTEIGEVQAYYIEDNERIPTNGHLYYRGISIEDLVYNFYSEKRFGFEETIYLLLFGQLPSQQELDEFNQMLDDFRELPANFVEDMILRNPSNDIMNKMARSVLNLYAYDPNADDITAENIFVQCVSLISRFPALAAYGYMAKSHYIDGKSLFIHAPKPEYSTAENLLHLMRPDGQFTELEARMLDLLLVLHAEHGGGNNSTFACRAVSSTGTDTYSAIAAAMGSLKGPRHGGAANKVHDMMADMKGHLSNWRDEYEIERYLTALLNGEAFDHSGLIYGMGHAVYTMSDPRATILRDYARELAYVNGREEEYDLYLEVERLSPVVFKEVRKKDKFMCANVDFYSGFVYSMLGIPPEMFTPCFAVSRVAGWSAHRIEELISGGRIMRPAFKSISPHRVYTPIDERNPEIGIE